jgi:hypothetical protein
MSSWEPPLKKAKLDPSSSAFQMCEEEASSLLSPCQVGGKTELHFYISPGQSGIILKIFGPQVGGRMSSKL